MAGDRRATAGYTIADDKMRKVFAADDYSAIAIAGAAGMAIEMVKLFQLELEHYEKLTGDRLSLEGKANRLAQLIRQNFPLAMQGLVVVPLFGGFDERRGRGAAVLLRRHRGPMGRGRLPGDGLGKPAREELPEEAVAPRARAEMMRSAPRSKRCSTRPRTTWPPGVRTPTGTSIPSCWRSRPEAPTRWPRSDVAAAADSRAAGAFLMSFMPYVAPEQMMKDRSEYAHKGIARGRSVIGMEYADGLLFIAENPSATLHKISEIYDQIAFAGVGQVQRVRGPADLGHPARRPPWLLLRPRGREGSRPRQRLQPGALDHLHPTDEALRGRRSWWERSMATSRRHRAVPRPVRRLGERRARVRRDRRARRRPHGHAEGPLLEGWELATAIKTAVEVLGSPEDRTIAPRRRIEAGVLDRTRASTAQVPSPRRRRDHRDPARLNHGLPAFGARAVGCRHGSPHLRAGERVRRHLHVPRPTAALARRGGAVPVPTGGALGSVLQRLPGERCAPLPGRGVAPRVRHARMRRDQGVGRPRQGGRADPGSAAGRGRDAPARGGHLAATSTSSRTTPTPPATPTDVTRTTWSPVTESSRAWPTCSIPFFVTRQIWCGAGKVLHGPRGAQFCISQRAEHIWEGVSSATTRSRPIINTRDEPHADAERFRRLHVIVGDSNMSEWTTFMKVGITDLVLRMVEGNTVMRDLSLENPIRAIREISHDTSCTRTVKLANGRELTAIEMQTEYFEKTERFIERRGADETSKVLLREWREALDALRDGEPERLARKVDWVTKRTLIERYMAKHGLALASPRIALLDLAYPRREPGPRPLLPAGEVRQGRARGRPTRRSTARCANRPSPRGRSCEATSSGRRRPSDATTRSTGST